MHAIRRLLVGVVVGVAVAPAAARQSEAPSLSRQQRTAMQALVRAADAPDIPTLAPADWPIHVLRASDGSHYVAFSLNRAEGLTLNRPIMLYVRLATRSRPNEAVTPERSAVAEWLAGQAPTPILPQRGLAFGEMPTYGAAGIAQRGATLQAQNLQILELERERAREKREAQERYRKASLEGAETTRAARPLLPFEDFDLRAQAVADSTGTPVLRRSLTTGPGDYELTVSWIDAAAEPPADVHVARRAITLPPASTTGLALSSVIVADDVAVRETPVPANEQSARPYSLGGTEITPAKDHKLAPDERLALVVQVINARGSPNGKPDVEVGFRVFRREAGREENVGSLTPQHYNELTLPVDFDVAKGHPIFAAVAIPLRTFKRGDYRLEVAANDRVAGVGVITEASFTVAATPAALLREAPSLARSFDPSVEPLPAEVAVIRGGVFASDGNDREAIAAWQNAIDAGSSAAVLWPLMIDAAMRLSDVARAKQLAERALSTAPNQPRVVRQLAAAHIMAREYGDAVSLLDALLTQNPDDLETQWLTLHALFSGFVNRTGPGAAADGPTRIADLAARYAAANGPHAALARDWAAAIR